MTKSLGQKLFEAKEKYHKKKSLFYIIVPWKMLKEGEQKVWRKHAKTLSGIADMQFYLLGGMAQYLPQKKKKPPLRYLNKPSTTENNVSRTESNQSLLNLLDMGNTLTTTNI